MRNAKLKLCGARVCVCDVVIIMLSFVSYKNIKVAEGVRGIIRIHRIDVKMSQDEENSDTKILRFDVSTQILRLGALVRLNFARAKSFIPPDVSC